jgi:hypothetical protein
MRNSATFGPAIWDPSGGIEVLIDGLLVCIVDDSLTAPC